MLVLNFHTQVIGIYGRNTLSKHWIIITICCSKNNINCFLIKGWNKIKYTPKTILSLLMSILLKMMTNINNIDSDTHFILNPFKQ